CEWASNYLTKLLERPRLAAYLEQSTRYIAYDSQLDGFGYRYHRDPRFGPAYEAAMDELFASYTALLTGVSAWVDEKFPAAEGESRLRNPRAASGPGRPLDRVPARAERGSHRRGRAARPRRERRRRGRCSLRAPAPHARQRGGAARRASLRVLHGRRGAGARGRLPPAGRGAHRARPRPRRRAREQAPPAWARLRDAHVPLRDRLRLRRVPRPGAAPT